MFESVIEFNNGVSGDTPDLGEGHKALPPLLESVLELRRRLLPADHPDIGEGHKSNFSPNSLCFDNFAAMACHNLSVSYYICMLNTKQLETLPRAMETAREALRIWQSILPPGHKNIAAAEKQVQCNVTRHPSRVIVTRHVSDSRVVCYGWSERSVSGASGMPPPPLPMSSSPLQASP
jgi:hypothetical protein